MVLASLKSTAPYSASTVEGQCRSGWAVWDTRSLYFSLQGSDASRFSWKEPCTRAEWPSCILVPICEQNLRCCFVALLLPCWQNNWKMVSDSSASVDDKSRGKHVVKRGKLSRWMEEFKPFCIICIFVSQQKAQKFSQLWFFFQIQQGWKCHHNRLFGNSVVPKTCKGLFEYFCILWR